MSVIGDAFPRSFQHATVSFGDEQIPILKQHSSPCTSLFFGSFLRLVRLELIAQECCQLLKAQKLMLMHSSSASDHDNLFGLVQHFSHLLFVC